MFLQAFLLIKKLDFYGTVILEKWNYYLFKHHGNTVALIKTFLCWGPKDKGACFSV